jgi:hypothetical protein
MPLRQPGVHNDWVGCLKIKSSYDIMVFVSDFQAYRIY